jgi:ankyrin repeat protein
VQLGAPLCNAAGYGDVEMMAKLLDAGAELDGPGPNTPLLLAARSHNGDAALAYLLERGADPTRTDEAGHSALLHAAARQSLLAVRLLVEHGADTTSRPTQVRGGVNALHMAAIGNRASHASPEVLAYLLEQPGLRAQIDVRDEWGRTPLCCAATYGTAADVRVLLQAGADPTIANKDGQSPLAIAHARGLQDMIAVFDQG